MTDTGIASEKTMDTGDTAAAPNGAATAKDIAQFHLWNDEIAYVGDHLRVHDLIEVHMIQEPSAPSVCAWDGGWTYAELDRLSSALASNLTAHGIGCEDFVPLYFRKSKWTAVAILAVVRSGAAFVLLDDAHPLPRLREICSEMQATLVLAAEELEEQARQLVDGAPLVRVGESSSLAWITQDKQVWRASPVTGASALYAVFTSGSTGRPKGAVIEHASLCAAAMASGRVLGMSAQSRAFQFASFAFDPTIMDFLRTWIHGACVCIPSPEQAKNDIAGAFTALRANIASLTPSVARMLDVKALPGMQVLEFAGEPMLPTDVEKWADHVMLVNAYGNAECSVYTVMRSPMRHDTHPNNIGFPVACVAWIVDEADANILLPIGHTGELVLEGPAVGRGYLKNAAMTAASFISAPPWLREFRGDSTGKHRLYKTGDLAQYQPDGSILCLGRKDTQTKIRGQRIELSEVELHMREQLHTHDEVVAEVVRLEDRGNGRAVLVAYVRLHDAMRVQEAPHMHSELFAPATDSFRLKMEEIERVLQARVPAYMVPSAFVALNYVPLSLSGKTDRRRLKEETSKRPWAEIEAYMLATTDQSLPPTTDLEKKLQSAFGHVLGLNESHFSLHESFFRRGGDSILAMQLSAHCRAQGLPITTQEIFQHPTISSLRDVIVMRQASQDQLIGQPFPLSPAQHMLLQKYKASEPGDRYSSSLNTSRVMRVAKSTNLGQLESALQALVYRHTALRTSFTIGADGQWAQVVKDPAQRSFLCLPVHIHAAELASNLKELNSHCELLNIHNGPLLLVHFVSFEGSDHKYLLLVAPEVVVDSKSWEIIIKELSIFLESGNAPARRTAGSFHSWLNKMTPSEAEPANWDASESICTDYNKMNSIRFGLDSQTATSFWQMSADILRADPKEIFLGVLFHTFKSIFPDRENMLIFVESDGRTKDVSREVGQFTTYIPVTLSMTTDMDLLGAVGQAKDAYRAASRKGGFCGMKKGQSGVFMHWKTKEKRQAPAGHVENGICQFLQPSRPSDDKEVLVSSFKLGTFEIIVEQSQDSLDVQLVGFQNTLQEDGARQWFELCRTSLAELPHRLSEAVSQPRVSDFSQLSMSQENLDSLIDNVLFENPGVNTPDIEEIYPLLHSLGGEIARREPN